MCTKNTNNACNAQRYSKLRDGTHIAIELRFPYIESPMLLQEAPQVMVSAKTFKALRTIANATGAGASGHGQLHLSQNSGRHLGPFGHGNPLFQRLCPCKCWACQHVNLTPRPPLSTPQLLFPVCFGCPPFCL